jgi:signal transduction protein with GAF and PtsI domain
MDASRGSYFRAIYDIAVTINSGLEPWKLLRTVAQCTAQALDGKACSIMLLTPDGKELRHGAEYGLSEWYVRKGPVTVDTSMREALQGRAIPVVDAETDPRVLYSAEARQEGISSMLSVPLKLKSDVVGVVRVYSAERREFTEEEIEFVEAVGHLGAIALENARNYQQMRDNYETLFKYIHKEIPV